MRLPQYSDVESAYERIKNRVRRTPVLTCKSLNEIAGAEFYFKCENFQKVGAFKFRGATNAVLLLSDEQAKKGVATHSSGNHAQALALAAKNRGIRAQIVMPSNSPDVKINAVKGYGAEIHFCEPTLEAREATLAKIVEKSGAIFIHPYRNFDVISGQGTAAKELIEDVPKLDVVMAPVGGGGLLSGTCLSAAALSPETKIVAGEPKGADDAARSLEAGEIIPSTNPKTIADGLLTSLSDRTFAIISKHVDRILTAGEESIVESLKLIFERAKIVVEPSAAVCFAAALENRDFFAGKRVAIILSGGNIDLKRLANIFSK